MESQPRVDVSRPTFLSVVKLLIFGIANLRLIRAAPVPPFSIWTKEDADDAMPADSPTLWIYLAVAVGLVLLGGAFAGLTIALMGQDEIYLQVIKTSGEGSEKKHAAKVLKLLGRGKHWVLVTLLLGNVITNETLPIVLDRSLGGGWPAVLGSTILIVIFGEIIPQSICVRYGLPIGAWMSPLVLILMYILAPVAWPTAKLLDRLLGEDHGTTYKKAGLKTLVTLHKTLGSAGEQLNSDEVTIISAVLDLKEKPIGSIMTPMDNVFTMSADDILDEKTMDVILSAGYSRIPIHDPDNPLNFVGMLLVKILITYDPEDCKAVRDFALATLPETYPDTSCLDIVNFFQEGKSHMVLVSDNPAGNSGALGVVTLEDVIEELIGEEIIDESDVFVDIHKAIRRTNFAPRSRVLKGKVVAEPQKDIGDTEENLIDLTDEDGADHDDVRRVVTEGHPNNVKSSMLGDRIASPKTRAALRRTSSTTGTSNSDRGYFQMRADTPEMREHLKHLGPSNLASRPRQTRYNTVKIKPGGSSIVEGLAKRAEGQAKATDAKDLPNASSLVTAPRGGVGEGLLSSAGKDAKDGVLALRTGYGTVRPDSRDSLLSSEKRKIALPNENSAGDSRPGTSGSKRPRTNRAESLSSQDTVVSLSPTRPRSRQIRGGVRSGSITENIVDVGGIKKVVLEPNSSSSDDVEQGSSGIGGGQTDGGSEPRKKSEKPHEEHSTNGGGRKKRRRKKRKDGHHNENAPLIEADEK